MIELLSDRCQRTKLAEGLLQVGLCPFLGSPRGQAWALVVPYFDQ